jgi:hypothetical protein
LIAKGLDGCVAPAIPRPTSRPGCCSRIAHEGGTNAELLHQVCQHLLAHFGSGGCVSVHQFGGNGGDGRNLACARWRLDHRGANRHNRRRHISKNSPHAGSVMFRVSVPGIMPSGTGAYRERSWLRVIEWCVGLHLRVLSSARSQMHVSPRKQKVPDARLPRRRFARCHPEFADRLLPTPCRRRVGCNDLLHVGMLRGSCE